MFSWYYRMYHQRWHKALARDKAGDFVRSVFRFRNVMSNSDDKIRDLYKKTDATLVLSYLRDVRNNDPGYYKVLVDFYEEDLKLAVKVYRESEDEA